MKLLQLLNIDDAERGVEMMQDYNLALTKDERQKQYLLQVVEAHRKFYSTASRPK